MADTAIECPPTPSFHNKFTFVTQKAQPSRDKIATLLLWMIVGRNYGTGSEVKLAQQCIVAVCENLHLDAGQEFSAGQIISVIKHGKVSKIRTGWTKQVK